MSQLKMMPLTVEKFDRMAEEAMLLLFHFKTEKNIWVEKEVKLYSCLDGTLVVFRGSVEVYQGKDKAEAVNAYNKAVGV